MMDYLSLCAIVKDEKENYLREWFNYHHLVGVERFYIYDNESRIPVRQTFAEEISNNQVVVIDAPGKTMQYPAYTHCLHYYGQYSRWIGFIDADEFIVPKSTDDLRELMAAYEMYAALGINWLIFGSSGHEKIIGDSQINNFMMRTDASYQDNKHVKIVAQPQHTILAITPHEFVYRNGMICVNDDQQPIIGSRCNPSVEKVHINHYFCRSREEFLEKISRGRADVDDDQRDTDWFDKVDAASTIEDHTIINLKNRLEDNRKTTPLPEHPHHLELLKEAAQVDVTTFMLNRLQMVTNEARNQSKLEDLEIAAKIVAVRYPGFFGQYLVLSDIFLILGRPDYAWQQLSKANEISGNYPELWKRIGWVLHASGDLEKAARAFEMYIDVNPNDTHVLLSLGKVYSDLNQLQPAIDCLNRVIQVDPANRIAWSGLAEIKDRIMSKKP